MIFHIAVCSPDAVLRGRVQRHCLEYYARRADACIVEQLEDAGALLRKEDAGSRFELYLIELTAANPAAGLQAAAQLRQRGVRAPLAFLAHTPAYAYEAFRVDAMQYLQIPFRPEQVLDKIQDELGVMSVARPPEMREYGFLPAGVYDKDTFALRLMDKPASYFYSVLWNKLYRRDLLTRNDIQFVSEMHWAEDLVFNLRYIQYAETFVSIGKAGYYYVQNPQSICHTQVHVSTVVQNKLQVFRYYKDLYTRLGMYEEVRPQLYKFLVDIAESTYPSGPFKKAIDEAKAYWKEHKPEQE